MRSVNITAITFNIHAFIAQFWTLYHKERTIGKLLEQGHYEIVCLQEAWHSAASRIIQHYGHYNAVHSHRETCCGLYGNGLATLSTWIIVQKGFQSWLHHNPAQFEGGIGADKGFSWVKLEHPETQVNIVVYNLHGFAPDEKHYCEKKIYDNFKQLAEYINDHHPEAAVLVGGDFNCRHRWRPLDARPTEGPVDLGHCYNNTRYDQFRILMSVAGLTDSEWVIKGEYAWSSPVDRWFFKSGKNVKVSVKSAVYLYKDTPWTGLSDHHPYSVEFTLEF